jgi:hypothetical protein
MGKGEHNRGNETTRIYYVHIWKCHNKTPLYKYYKLIKNAFETKKIQETTISQFGNPLEIDIEQLHFRNPL